LKQKVLCVDSFDDLKDLVVKDKWNFWRRYNKREI
jgi:hypothetical protein